MRPAAGVIYKRQFGTKPVYIEESVNDDSGLFDQRNWIEVKGFKVCLLYLRCLGSSISDLRIQYNGWNQEQSQHIHQYVNSYGAESLVKIELHDKPNQIFID